MKKHFLLSLCALFFINIDACEISMRVTEGPPLTFRDQNGQWTGLDVQLANALLSELGCTLTFKNNRHWQRALHHLQRGKIDLVPSLSMTKERAQTISFIGPYRDEKVIFISKKEQTISVNTLEDFKQFNPGEIGIAAGSYYGHRFNEKLTNDADFASVFIESNSDADNLRKVLKGDIKGAVGDFDQMMFNFKSDDKYKQLKIHSYVINAAPVYFGFSKKSVPLEFTLKAKRALKSQTVKVAFEEIIQQYNNEKP